MQRNFWDIDSLTMGEETVDCIFQQQAVGLGHLDPLRASSGSRDLPRGTVLSLPLWMILPLRRIQLVQPVLPERFKAGIQNMLRKGAEGARLGDKSRSYFKVGLTLAWLVEGGSELAASIFIGMLHRIKFIIDRSAHTQRNEDKEAEFIHLLTSDEKEVYLAGVSANEEYDQWRHGMLGGIRPRSEMLPLLRRSAVFQN